MNGEVSVQKERGSHPDQSMAISQWIRVKYELVGIAKRAKVMFSQACVNHSAY